MKNKSFMVALLGLILLSAGCADSVPLETALGMEPIGFWHGFWHGLILPIAWICSLFFDDVSIYAIYNNGGWYDFGFFFGVATVFASSHTQLDFEGPVN